MLFIVDSPVSFDLFQVSTDLSCNRYPWYSEPTTNEAKLLELDSSANCKESNESLLFSVTKCQK